MTPSFSFCRTMSSLLLFLFLCCHLISAKITTTKSNFESSSNSFILNTNLAHQNSPFQIHSDKNEWRIIMPRTSLEEWDYFFASSSRIHLQRSPKEKEAIDVIQPREKNPSLLKELLVEEFNFKGFGLSLYKSFQAFSKCGFALRVPVFSNLDWWDSQPALPSVNLMFCLYFPFKLSFGISSSIDIQAVKWTTQRSFAHLLDFFEMIVKYVVVYLSAILSLAKVQQHQHFQEEKTTKVEKHKVQHPKPQYKTDIQERLGCTMWYKYSLQKGFHNNMSLWHMYLPTLRACQRVFNFKSIPFNQYFPSIGSDTTFVPNKLYLTGLFSLSGLHLPSRKKTNKAKTTSPASPEQVVVRPVVKLLPLEKTIACKDTPHRTKLSPNHLHISIMTRGGNLVSKGAIGSNIISRSMETETQL